MQPTNRLSRDVGPPQCTLFVQWATHYVAWGACQLQSEFDTLTIPHPAHFSLLSSDLR
jgi:hypothetical protein